MDAAAVVWAPDPRRRSSRPPLAAARTGPFVGRDPELAAVTPPGSAPARAAGGWSTVERRPRCRGVPAAAQVDRSARPPRRVGCRPARYPARRRLAPWAEAASPGAATVPGPSSGSPSATGRPTCSGWCPRWPSWCRLPAPRRSTRRPSCSSSPHAVDELIARWSAIDPLVVVLDDLEDADPGTLTVLRRVATSHRGGRVLLVAG